MPRNIALLKISLHFLSFIPILVMPLWMPLVMKGTNTRPAAMERVITHTTEIKIDGSVMVAPPSKPAALSTFCEATVS